MDQVALVERQIDDGQKLVEMLRAGGFDVTAAWWMKASEERLWFLYIASKEVDEKGIAAAYRALSTARRGMEELWVDTFEVKLVGADKPITKDVLRAFGRHPGRMPLRYFGPPLGDVSVEEAYIYPPLANGNGEGRN
jgi:hypothetical protein